MGKDFSNKPLSIRRLSEELTKILEDSDMYGGFYKEQKELISLINTRIQGLDVKLKCVTRLYYSGENTNIEIYLDNDKCGYAARLTIGTHITNEDYRGNGKYHVVVTLHNFMPRQMPYEVKEILDELSYRTPDSYYLIDKEVDKLNLKALTSETVAILNEKLRKIEALEIVETSKPYQVINKDNGDVFEFDSVSEARAKANLLKDQDFQADIRIAKVDKSGTFLKWI